MHSGGSRECNRRLEVRPVLEVRPSDRALPSALVRRQLRYPWRGVRAVRDAVATVVSGEVPPRSRDG